MSSMPEWDDNHPRSVHTEEHLWIPMRDGTRLAARMWLPKDADRHPVPAILEYIPYRKRDFTRVRDATMHPQVAAHGYACVRVDLRGSGDSEGVLRDEYLPQELADGYDVIAWLAAQPWCTGRVGMIGISWGGFNALQIAAMQPPALRAVITVCSTDDRYADDIHHMGGCLLSDSLSWASVMFAYNSLPPDPEIVGERWRAMWLERLQGSGLWLEKWLRHQRRDAYWKHGSICEDYAAVRCPVFAISGWADGYSNAVFRLIERLNVPRRGLIGPWSHKYPHLGVPGPAIDFLSEAIRWWDHWLKDVETGIMDEPPLRLWMQESVPPVTQYEERPGRWIAERSWPAPHIERQHYSLGSGTLVPGETLPAEEPLTIQSPLTVGLFAGKWCSYAAGPDLAHDQRQEDGGALVFETAPLSDRVEMCGEASVHLRLASNLPLAMLAARISDVAPDDKATRVTYGLLNLTHRHSAESPALLVPGEVYEVRIPLNHIAQAFPAGHRIRLALSTSYWPLAWPPPQPSRLTIFPQSSWLEIPFRQPRAEDRDLRPFAPPRAAAEIAHRQIEPPHHNWLVHRDLADDTSMLEVINDKGVTDLPDIDLQISNRVRELYSSRADDFQSVRGEIETVRSLRRGEWSTRTRTRTVLRCSADEFHIDADIDAFAGEARVFCHSWQVSVPRDFI